jgi:hypothetical protein
VARVSRQIGLLGSAGVTETTTWSQVTLTGLAGLATWSRRKEVLVGLLTQKVGLWKIRLTWKAGLHRIRLTQKAGLWKVRITRKTGLCKTQGGRKPEEGKGAAPSKMPAPRWCPRGITKTEKHKLQKMCQGELAEKKEEEEWDYWFNCLWPMTKPKQMWWEKQLAKEEGGSSGDSSSEEASKVTPARREDNLGSSDEDPESGNYNLESGNCHLESGNRNPNLGNSNPGKENDQQGEELVPMDINMVFVIPAEFCAPMKDVTELLLGAECAMLEKPENQGAHMKPLFIQGHLNGTPIGHMRIDGGASINILSLSLFKKLSNIEGDLKHTNLSLSGFVGDPTEAKGIICKELMVGSKTMPMAFFVVAVKGRYIVLLGRDWIHTNECVPSTLHQYVIQWIGDEVEVV